MKLGFFFSLACLASIGFTAPVDKGAVADNLRQEEFDCAANLLDNTVAGSLRKISFLGKLLPGPKNYNACQAYKQRLGKGKSGKGRGGAKSGGNDGGDIEGNDEDDTDDED